MILTLEHSELPGGLVRTERWAHPQEILILWVWGGV